MSWTQLKSRARTCSSAADFQSALQKTLVDMNCPKCTEHARGYFAAHPLKAAWGPREFYQYVVAYEAEVTQLKAKETATTGNLLAQAVSAFFGGFGNASIASQARPHGGCRSCSK